MNNVPFRFTYIVFVIAIAYAGCDSSSDSNIVGPAPVSADVIQGQVVDENGGTYGNLNIELRKVGTSDPIAQATTTMNGAYRFEGVAPGDYHVDLLKTPLGAELIGSERLAITIGEARAAAADFTLRNTPQPSVLVYADTDIMGEIRNADGQIPKDASERLYAANVFIGPNAGQVPIMAPDGHHVTLAEWQMATGEITASCSNGVSRYHGSFTGLIPDGVYTVWLHVLAEHKEPHEPVSRFTDLLGSGPAGPSDGSQTTVRAAADGSGSFSSSRAAGDMSMGGQHPECSVSEAEGLLFVLNYHIDGKTHGPFPGPDEDDAGHLHVYF